MYPELFDMNDDNLIMSAQRCYILVSVLNRLSKSERYDSHQENRSYTIYDSTEDIFLTTGKQIVGAFQYHILNWKE